MAARDIKHVVRLAKPETAAQRRINSCPCCSVVQQMRRTGRQVAVTAVIRF